VLIDVAEWRQDILEEHVSELEPLWRRRLGMERSASVDAVGLGRCDARIDANSDALALAEDAAWPLVEKALTSGDPALAAAAAMVVATSADSQGEAALVDVIAAASDEVRAAIRFALLMRTSPSLLAALGPLADSTPPVAASLWAITVLRTGVEQAGQRERWMVDPSPEARRLMWQVEARVAGRRRPGDRGRQTERADYERGFDDPDREVRRLAVEAAARSGQRWLVERLRGTAASPSLATVDEHMMLAMLAENAEQPLVAALGRCEDLGWYRLSLLALAGSAEAVEALLEVIQRGPPVDAALAGAAFHRITGIDASGEALIPLLPEGAEPDESADEIRACDPERAQRGWQAVKGRMARGRWHYGAEAGALTAARLPPTFDLETRFCLQTRAAFEHPGTQIAFDGETFPFR
jgi:hypothetical protein